MTVSSPIGAIWSAWAASADSAGQAAGVGIDLVEVGTLRDLVESGGPAFLDAAWTPREQRDANRQPEGLAGKWAAKEAVMKALQRGIGDVDPLDVEILTTQSGAPRVELHRTARAAARERKIGHWHISVTHEDGWAAAIAIASPDGMRLTAAVAATPEGGSRG
jgi:holo-[acyl-carrier protein] synthase